MDINFITHEELTTFFHEIKHELQISLSKKGRLIEVIPNTKSLRIESSPEKVSIFYIEKAHLFRALCLWMARSKETFIYEETPNFEKIGPMLDLSRNAVMTVPQLKRFILLCSKMGLNSLMMYMEDTYEIPEYPYFGYQRGCYSQSELKELDQYADCLGVELIPAIQTLAHLTNPLKWGFANGIRDTADILLVGEEKTYHFVNAAIRAIRSCFKTNRIHIGMDEAHELGRGQYLQKHGLEDRFSIMQKHLTKVTEICLQYDLEPIMWSDMFFRIGSKSGDYYDSDISFPDMLIENMPQVTMVYWDYYHHNEEQYERLFIDHKKLKRPVIFAGGIWTWNGLAPNYGKSLAATKAGLNAAKKQGITQVFATLWGDDGAETPVISSLLGLQQFSEEQFSKTVDWSLLSERFMLFHKLKAADFLLLNQFDQTLGVEIENPHGSNPSKLALYQDIMYGLYEKTLEPLELSAHYQTLTKSLEKITFNQDTKHMFTFYQQLAEVLSQKIMLSEQLRMTYHHKKKSDLLALVPSLQKLTQKMQRLHHLHRQLWFDWNKPFGFEIIDLRYGALLARLETTIWRINEYHTGKITQLTEFELKLLPFDSPFEVSGSVGRNLFHGIYSASKLSDV